MTDTSRWTRATKDNPCVACGHTRGCLNAPDGTAASCFDDGNAGKVIQLGKSNGHAGRNLNGTTTYSGAAFKKKSGGKVHPNADAAIKASAWNINGAILSAVWVYPGDTFKIARFDTPDEKHIRPVHLVDGGWKVGDPPGKLPLYRFDEIPSDAQIVVVAEGEKCTDLFWSIGMPATTSSHGSGSADRSDWNPIADKGAVIVFAPDNDPAGEKYVADACRIIFQRNRNAKIKIIRLPGLPEGGDIEQYLEERDSLETEAIAGSIVALADAAPFVGPDDVSADADSTILMPTSLGLLWQQFPELREAVIGGMLRRGQVGNIISTSKSYKTYLMLGMAICMAIGRMWLDRFEMIGGRVLIIDLELQPGDIVRRTREIAAAMHAPLDVVAENIHIQSLRGKSGTVDQIERLILSFSPGDYDLVIVDPLYKTYPENFDENSNAHMTALYRRWERLAEHLDAALFIVHHGTKGSQADKRTVDVGAGASAQSRSADAHIALREHEVDNCVVFDARIRSFAPIDPMVLRWEYPQWQRDLGLNPEDIKTGRKSRNADKAEPAPKEPPPEPWTEERFLREFATDRPQDKQTIMARASMAGVSVRLADGFIRVAIANRKLFRWVFPKNRAVLLANVEQPVTETVEVGK
jgi:hypothetical protein